jgi:hypothetical protein
MSANPVPDFNHLFEDIITSYEDRIQKIQNAFESSENISESTHSLFDHVHNSISDLKKEREQLDNRLCEILAKNGSLRKKDYHTMMSGILCTLDAKEKEAEDQFLHFIEDQKNIAKTLKHSLLEFKDITSPDSGTNISAIKEKLSQITHQQELSKQAVIKSFTDFQSMHNKIMGHLEQLLSKGDHIMIQDIKKIKDKIIKEITPSGFMPAGNN